MEISDETLKIGMNSLWKCCRTSCFSRG